MDKQRIRELRKQVAPFEKSQLNKSIFQVINTILPLFLVWTLAYLAFDISVWLSVGLAVIAAGFMVRTFIIFHDCTHGSFFKNKKANNIMGNITGILTLFAYEKWKREHSIHHATSSNLDKRGTGDMWVMTVEEYTEATPGQRLAYRLYRNPLVMFGLGPIYLFLVSSRINRKDARSKERWNTHFITLAVVVLYTLAGFLLGWKEFAIIQGTTVYVAGVLGIWLFYVQHQFEDSYFEEEAEWDYVKAAVDGSSYYQLPKVLQWLTGNIGYHHVHHLSPRVPNYLLEEAHEKTPPLQKATTITLATSLTSLKFRLYDEAAKTFISFKDWKQRQMRTRTATSQVKG